MRIKLLAAFVFLVGSAVLGATVLQEPLARAAAPIASVFVSNDASHPVPVRDLAAPGDTATRYSSAAETCCNLLMQGGTTVVPTVPVGQRFIATYASVRSQFTNVDLSSGGVCDFAVLTFPINLIGFGDALVSLVPLAGPNPNTSALAGSATMFLPLNSGERLAFQCYAPESQLPIGVTVAGYFVGS
jgi:hypothetical protein